MAGTEAQCGIEAPASFLEDLAKVFRIGVRLRLKLQQASFRGRRGANVFRASFPECLNEVAIDVLHDFEPGMTYLQNERKQSGFNGRSREV